MVTANDLLNDDRFYIDNWNANRITKGKIRKYKVTKVKVGNIYRMNDGGLIKLSETPVYHYLASGGTEDKEYRDYCDRYCKGNVNRGIEEFNSLLNSFTADSYDMKKGAIFVDQMNCILEGQHRCCILLYKYGED